MGTDGQMYISQDDNEAVWKTLLRILRRRMQRGDFTIHHIGDIHGCNTALQEYLAAEGGMKDDELYIFVGDYIDRGLQNAEVVKFLLSVMDRKNVLLLEGNHEKNLWLWANEKEALTGSLNW